MNATSPTQRLTTIRRDALRRDVDRLVAAATALGTTSPVGPLRRWWSQVDQVVELSLAGELATCLEARWALRRALTRVADVLACLDGAPPAGAAYPDVDLLAAASDLRRLLGTLPVSDLVLPTEPSPSQPEVSRAAFEIPWLLDGLDDQTAEALVAELPTRTRVRYRMIFRPWYRWLLDAGSVDLGDPSRSAPAPARVPGRAAA